MFNKIGLSTILTARYYIKKKNPNNRKKTQKGQKTIIHKKKTKKKNPSSRGKSQRGQRPLLPGAQTRANTFTSNTFNLMKPLHQGDNQIQL